ncbi:hypothetical protein IW148_000476 [Coemansia sp. RSA 1199]|nr:hypothetical protein IW148_000476 [Coemansia sp. RSA 1199]
MPRLVAAGWKQDEIENMLIVLLDHGNNQDVRVFGLYTLHIYMVVLGGRYSERTTDLFTNALSLRAFSYADMPEASRVAGDIMCAIASGIDIVDIGCGQRAIIGFKEGRSSICPVLQDVACPVNPQGILALRMLRNMLALMSYLASLLPDPQAAQIEYSNLGLICYQFKPFKFAWNHFKTIYDIPQSAPLLAMSHSDIRSSLTNIYQLFRRAYLSWIYPAEEEAYKDRHIRRVPVLGLQVIVNFMLENLVPQHTYMISEKEFHMPNLGENLENDSSSDSRYASDSESKIATGIGTMGTRSYDVLRHIMLDHDIKSAYFFTDILRLSLQVLPNLETEGVGDDCFGKEELARVSYDVCLGALTVIRLWLISKEEYRPIHLIADEEDSSSLSNVVSDYLEHVYGLMIWIVNDNQWTKKKVVLMYNALLVHRIVMRQYHHNLPLNVRRKFMDSLQKITLLFLSKPSLERRDEVTMESYPNRVLLLLTECLISGWFVLGDPVSAVALRFKELYIIPTVWTSHLNGWCNVLRALTIARGRHILKVDERTLIQESMFAGQRQRRGMNKVDEFMSKLQSPAYHLECTTLHDSLETSTPFSITSNMTWDTMRFVFECTHTEAKEELAFTEACVQQDQSTESKLANPKSDYQSRALLRVTQSIYAHIFLSGPKNLTQLTSEMLSESLVKSKKTIKVPRRTFRRVSSKRSKLIPGGLLRMDSTGKSNRGVKSGKQVFVSEPGTPAVKETEAFRVWQRIASPFRRKHHTGALPTPPEHPGTDVGMEEADCFSGIHNQRSTQSAQPLKQANRAPSITQDDACSQRKRQVTSSRMPTLTWDDAEDVDAHSDSMISVHEHDDGNSMLPIGPARLEATFVEPKALPKYTHQHPKSSTRVPNLSLQLSDVAAFNRTAAVHLLGDIKKRIWQLEAVWTNFHISDFVYAQDDMIGDLQRMWLVWVSLLGSPTEANTIKSKIILRGLVKSWDVYRAVLDCSRYTPDNDDVLLNTTLWVAEMAAKYGTTDHRGRVAQTAIFRMGCRCSDHINSRVVFLRSRFLQSALITLSPLSKGQPVNIDQVHMFLVECKLFLSLGISGSRMLLLSLERGLRRIFIGCSTYSGSLPEPALQSAAVMLVSMATMLSSGRVLATHSANKRIRELTDSNIVNLAEDSKLAALVIREMLLFLLMILIKAPELIVREDSQVANADAQSIRNFLVENVIYRCANPEARVSDQAHKYNQELGSTASEHGLVLYLQSVGYSQHVSMSLGDFVLSSEDEQRFIGSPAESIKQIGEVLYVTLMARFDENNRLGNYGAIKHPLKMDLFRSQVQHNMGFDTTRTNGNYFMPLSKSDALLREINSLDRMRAQETIKIAVLYVGPGQWTEAEILSNTQQDTSQAYRNFVRSLGWSVDLATFNGYIGKLERDGSDGKTCPYFFDEGIEVVFHDATLMPTDKNDIRQLKKKRHIGNDHVHIIWNESHHNYRPETISGDFGNVQIQIRPLEPGEYGVGLYCDDQVKPFGPLLNGMVVSADVLPTTVRTTAIVGHRRAAQVFFKTFMHPYAMRQETINRISERHIDESCKSYMKVNQDALSYLQIFDARKHPNMHSQSKYREAVSLFKRQEAVAVFASDMASAILADIRGILSKMKSMRAACFRIKTELLLADLESLAQFSYAVVKLHRLINVMEPTTQLIQEFLALDQSAFIDLGCLITDTVNFETSRNEERVVVAKDVSSKVDELREQFGDLNTILAEASAEMEDMAAVPVIAVYFPQLGFLSSIDISYFSSESTIAPQLNDWELEFQTDQQRYYKNILTDALDRSPGDVFTLVNDAEAEVCLELQGKICAYIPEITRAAELAAQIDCLQRTLVLLGPNGSGKSVLIKQVALIVYLAHVGSFVPATSANIGLTERIMVMGRASESLVRQQSALSTDLQAVAGILKHSGYKTMVLLDEFGRGTSPADGIGLLCGVLTSLVLRPGLRPACLAVTHFQEITQVQAIRHIWRQIQVRTMAIRENANGLVYLFKSSDSAAPSSAYAIMCARGAGIPDQILDRAQELVGDYTEDDR